MKTFKLKTFNKLIHGVLITAALLMFSFSCTKEPQFMRTGLQPADLVIVNAEVITCDDKNPQAEALAVKNGKITYVGGNDGIADFVGPETKVFNGRGRVLTPGFVDNHCHVLWIGALTSLMTTELFNCETADEIKNVVLRHASEHPDRLMVIAQGWKPHCIPEGTDQLKLLDSWISDRPVALMSYHATGWVNSKMLALMQQRNPDAFQRLVPDMSPDGKYNGLLRHFHAFNPLDFATLEELGKDVKEGMFNAMTRVLNEAISVGVTTMDDVQIYKSFVPIILEFRERGGLDKVRVRCGFYLPNTVLGDEEALRKDLTWWKELGETESDSRLVMGKSVKLYIDGVASNHTALNFEPYADKPNAYGDSVWTQKGFDRVIEIVDSMKLQACTHCCGDAGINMVINSYERAYKLHGQKFLRHRADHCSRPVNKDIYRMAEVGVYAAMQPAHFFGDKTVENALGPARLNSFQPWGTMEKAGVNLSFGSDWCAGPINPVYGLIVANTRMNYKGNTDWGPEEKITLENAIRHWTINSANALFMEKEIGSIETGKYADFVLFNTSPLGVTSWWFFLTHEIDLGKLDDFVDLTVVRGNIVYQKKDAEF
ncbi:MAG TPA: amidohydrolase [Ignavibacteria bacterium]|nr:amidohydrolase [Ignavibacteria bacterium]